MINTGIDVPEEIEDEVTVYYSIKENPTKDITNPSNGWKIAENVEDWDNIKTLIPAESSRRSPIN